MQKTSTEKTRLQGFGREWETKRLSDIASIRNQKTVASKVAADTPCIELNDIDQGSGKLISYSIDQNSGSPKYRFFSGDVLFGRLRSYLRKFWYADRDGICTTEIWPLTTDPQQIVGGFLYAIVQSDRFIEAASISYGTHMPRADWGVLRNFEVNLPQIDEQHAIARALSDVDGLLRALEALIAKKQAIKQSTMQQLLTGKTRLPGYSGTWQTRRLHDIGLFKKGRGIKRENILKIGYPCVRYGELYTQYQNYVNEPTSYISATVADEALPINSGDILFAGSGETAEEIGRCAAYLGDTQAFAGSDIIVLTPVGQNSMFLSHLINCPLVAKQKSRLGQGDAVVHISSQNLGQLEVNLPSRDEQTAIATVLSNMDAEITVLKRRQDKIHAIKQGMMQQLLTGRIRLIESTPDTEKIAC